MKFRYKVSKKVVALLSIIVLMVLLLAIAETEKVVAFDSVKQYESIEKSAKGFSEYKLSNDSLIDGLSKKELDNVRCTVTFNEAISMDELKKLCEEEGVDLKVVETRHSIGDERYTTATIFNGNFADLQNELHEITNDLGGGFVGIVDIYACVDSKSLDKIRDNQKVFLVDISGDAASMGHYVKDGEKRNKAHVDDGLNDFPQALSWDLETMQ